MKGYQATVIAFLFVLTFPVHAQENQSFSRGDVLVNTGFSFAYYQYGLNYQRTLKILPTTASLEFALSDAFSVGPYVGFASWNYIQYELNFISLGGRLSWHFAPALTQWIPDLNLARWDIYLTGIVGVEIRAISEYNSLVSEAENKNKIIFGPTLGIKYLFNSTTGIFAEGGRGTFGYGTMGIAFKF